MFQKRWGQIDWRKIGIPSELNLFVEQRSVFKRVNMRWKIFIASVDIDKVAQELDFNALQDNIMSVAFCNVETVSVYILVFCDSDSTSVLGV